MKDEDLVKSCPICITNIQWGPVMNGNPFNDKIVSRRGSCGCGGVWIIYNSGEGSNRYYYCPSEEGR